MHKIFRIILPFCLAFTFIVCSIVPAFAVESPEFYDYRDFETDYYIDGENDIVTVNLPLNWIYYKAYSEDNSYVSEGYVNYNTLKTLFIPNGHTTYFAFYPFGSPFDLQFSGGVTVNGKFLDLNDLPEGSYFYYSMEWYAVWSTMLFEINDDPISTSIYVDQNGKVVADYDNEVGVTTYTYSDLIVKTFGAPIHQVGGAKGFAFGHRPVSVTYDNPNAPFNNDIAFKISEVQLVLSIPSLYRQREEGKVTNGLLNDILNSLDKLTETNDKIDQTNDKLDDTNNKLDSIINGDLDPDTPSGSGDISNSLDQEDALLSDAIDNWSKNSNLFINVTQIVKNYGSIFGAVSLFLSEFIEIPFFSNLLYFGLALGVISVILNIVQSLSSSGSRGNVSKKASNPKKSNPSAKSTGGKSTYYKRMR